MPPPPPRRNSFTNLIGVAAILLGGLGSLLSLAALLLAVHSPHGNTADPLGILVIFILPPGTLLAGIGLMLRRRWAYCWMILLTAALIALGVKGMIAPSHRNPAHAPKPGPAAEALDQRVVIQSTVCITIGTLVLLGLLSAPVRREFQPSSFAPAPMNPQWRVGHQGRDLMFYEEHHHGTWQRIPIDGEMLTGRAHHVIFFPSEENWQRYPEWARHRRNEIIARIKSRFCEPDYEYQESGAASSPLPPRSSHASAVQTRPDGTILPALGGLLCISAACIWFAAQGIRTGETRLPARFSGNHRVVLSESPALFWTSVGLLGTIGAASTATAAWLVFHRSRNHRS